MLAAALRILILACSFLEISGLGGYHHPQQTATATISGQVTDQSGAPIPGTVVSALRREDGKVSQAITGEKGSYAFAALLPGSYVLQASMTGFRQSSHGPIDIAEGNIAVVDFLMRLPPPDHVDYVLGYSLLPDLLAHSDAVVFCRIVVTGPDSDWEIGPGVSVSGSNAEAKVIEFIKQDTTNGPAGESFEFLREGKDSPLFLGGEYVAFLRWNGQAKRFVGVAGPHYFIEVKNGRIKSNSPLSDVKAGMPIGRLLSRLRALVK